MWSNIPAHVPRLHSTWYAHVLKVLQNQGSGVFPSSCQPSLDLSRTSLLNITGPPLPLSLSPFFFFSLSLSLSLALLPGKSGLWWLPSSICSFKQRQLTWAGGCVFRSSFIVSHDNDCLRLAFWRFPGARESAWLGNGVHGWRMCRTVEMVELVVVRAECQQAQFPVSCCRPVCRLVLA